MYGNVGLPTARGSGTNGYIQRNLSFIKKKFKLGNYKEIINQFQLNPLQSKKRIDNEIIEHEIKYKIEMELYDLKEKLKNDGVNDIEIENQIKLKREELKNKLLKNNNEFIDKKETHSSNKLKTSKMDLIKNALKIKEEYKIGEAFDTELQEKKKKENEEKKLLKLYNQKQNEKKRNLSDGNLKEKINNKQKYTYPNIKNKSRNRSRSNSKNYKHNKHHRIKSKEKYHEKEKKKSYKIHHHYHKEKRKKSFSNSKTISIKTSSSKTIKEVFDYNDL